MSEFTTIRELKAENARLRGIIDCGCNAIRDALAVSGGDFRRIEAVQRRMRREMENSDE